MSHFTVDGLTLLFTQGNIVQTIYCSSLYYTENQVSLVSSPFNGSDNGSTGTAEMTGIHRDSEDILHSLDTQVTPIPFHQCKYVRSHFSFQVSAASSECYDDEVYEYFDVSWYNMYISYRTHIQYEHKGSI